MVTIKTPTTSDESSAEVLRIAVDEQRRFHDELTVSFQRVKTKTLYYLGIILAVLTFLYSGALDVSKTTQERLFIPDQLYGMLFYFFGLGCLIYALLVLLHAMRPNARWEVYSDVTEKRVVGELDPTLESKEYLQSLINGYEEASTMNLKTHGKKADALKYAFFPMIVGAIILVVLRFFQ